MQSFGLHFHLIYSYKWLSTLAKQEHWYGMHFFTFGKYKKNHFIIHYCISNYKDMLQL